MVASVDGRAVELALLDEVPTGELRQGSVVDLFLARPEGVYHWVCTLSSGPQAGRAEVHLAQSPMFIQRRTVSRVGAGLLARVRKEHAARNGRSYEARVEDVSRGGLKLESACHLQTGDTVQVTMDISGSTVVIAGRVVMAYPSPDQSDLHRAHVSFLDDQAEARDKITHFVTSQLHDSNFEL
ncbi:MAG: PilZ domain-containing protein [Acidimicrobiales bacterium]